MSPVFSSREARYAAAVLGMFTLVSQAALLREFMVLYRGSELALGAFYGSWFVAIAVAAAAAGNSQSIRRGAASGARMLLAMYPIGAALGLVLLAGVRRMAGIPSWAPIPPDVTIIAGFAATLPVGFVTGVLFPTLCDAANPDAQQGASSGYAWEAAGAVVGGLASAAMFMLGFDGPTAIALTGLPVAAIALPWRGRHSAHARWVPVAVASLCLAVLVPPTGPALRSALSDIRLHSNLSGATVVSEVSTAHGLVTTARLGSGTHLLIDGELVLGVPSGPDVPVEAAFLAVQPLHRQRAIVLGPGRFALAVSLCLTFGQVEVVGPDRETLDALRGAWESVEGVLPPNLRLVAGDPRSRIREASTGAALYDLVIVGAGEPRTLQDNRLHTVEFFRELQNAMNQGGVAVTSFRSGENALTPEALRFGRSIRSSLAAVFPEVMAVPGDPARLFATANRGRLTLDRASLERRVRELGTSIPAAIDPAQVSLLAHPDRADWLEGQLAAGNNTEDLVNRDDRPVATFLSLLASLRMTASAGGTFLWGAREAGPLLPIGALVLVVLVAMRQLLRRPGVPGAVTSPMLIAFAGGTSIAATIVLMAIWRARVGALYGEVGLASSAVMIGVFLGAIAGRRLSFQNTRRMASAFCVASAGALLAMSWTLDATVDSSPMVLRLSLAAMLTVCGVIAGAAWPIAAVLGGADRVSQRLEAADHVGAATGAGLGGLAGLAILGAGGALHVLAAGMCLVLVILVVDAGLDTVPGRHFLASGTGRLLSVRSFPSPAATIIVAAVFLVGLWTWHASHGSASAPRTRLSSDELRAFERFDASEWRESPFDHYRLTGVVDPTGDAVVVASAATGPGPDGYGGQMNIALSIGDDGIVRRVAVLSHRETPAYTTDLPAWIQHFKGMNIRDLAAAGDRAVDAMTGATVTSLAVSGTVALAAGRVGNEILHLPMPTPAPERPWHAPLTDPSVWYAIVLLAGAIVVHFRGSANVRLGFLVASAVVGGWLLNVQLSAGWLLSLLTLNLPSFTAAPAVAVLGWGFLMLALVVGPVHCAHACPFGAIQECVSLIGQRLGLKVAMPAKAHSAFRAIKYLVLAALALLPFTYNASARLDWDPMAAVFSGGTDGTGALVVILSLAGSLFTFRFWCRGFCPVGAFFNLFNHLACHIGLSPARRHVACDLGIREAGDIDCLQCNRCTREAGTRMPTGSNFTQKAQP